MNILLTATLNRSLFTNGLNQNIIFFSEMLKDMGYNVSICVNHDVEESLNPPLGILIMEEHELDEYKFDYILQSGFLLKEESVLNAKRKNSRCKNIHIHYGNRLLTDIEMSVLDDKTSLSPLRVDESWVSPHYSFSIPYLQTYYNTQKVFVCPYIWTPKYMDESLRYVPNSPQNIGVMEPNLNITKNCLMPIFLIEKVFKEEPDLIEALQVYCSSGLRDKLYFKSLMSKLSIILKGKAFFGNRVPMHEAFSRSNVLVSHQLLNGLNYTYMEALYLDIPLIHNSEYIREAGYYYPEYDLNIGAEKLKEALKFHKENLSDYKVQAQKVIQRFSPFNENVRNQYRSLLA